MAKSKKRDEAAALALVKAATPPAPNRMTDEEIQLELKASKLIAFPQELGIELLDQFGGVDGIAKKIRDDYECATGMTRQRILSEMLQFLSKIVTKNVDMRKASDMTKDELNELIKMHLQNHDAINAKFTVAAP